GRERRSLREERLRQRADGHRDGPALSGWLDRAGRRERLLDDRGVGVSPDVPEREVPDSPDAKLVEREPHASAWRRRDRDRHLLCGVVHRVPHHARRQIGHALLVAAARVGQALAMPLVTVHTSSDLHDDGKLKKLQKDISATTARVLGKPEAYVM